MINWNVLRQLFLNDLFILGIIITNAVIIFVGEFGFATDAFNYIEAIFTVLFIFEMYVKISEWGFRRYLSSNWDRADFILVLASIPSLALIFFDNDVMGVNVFLTLRVLRVFKSFRIIKFMPDVDEFIVSIKRALRASYIILLGFFILIFITAMISNSMYKDIAPEYFGNPAQSIYAIFQLFSVEGWYEIPDLIAERTSPSTAFFTKVYFSGLLMVGGIMGLSLVNSIFVDAMVADNTDELEEEVRTLNDKIDALEQKIDKLLENSDKKD